MTRKITRAVAKIHLGLQDEVSSSVNMYFPHSIKCKSVTPFSLHTFTKIEV